MGSWKRSHLSVSLYCVKKRQNDIIRLCLKKDRRAQNELYRTHYNVMMSIAWRYSNSKDEAVEFLNAGFLKVIINLKKYDKKAPFEAWLRRVVTNEIIDLVRKRKRHQEKFEAREVEKLPEFEMNSTLPEEQTEKIEWIKTMVIKLPNMTSQVFSLYAFEGYKHAEIAEKLNMSEGTSQWHYSFAKQKLREWSNEQVK